MIRLAVAWAFAWLAGATLAPSLEAAGLAAPDLALAVLAAAAVARGPGWGAWAGLAVGLVVDVVALGRPGPVAPAYVAAGWAAGLFGRIFVARTRGLAAAAAIAGAAAEVILPAGGWAAGLGIGLPWWRPLVGAVWTGLLAPVAAAFDRPPERISA